MVDLISVVPLDNVGALLGAGVAAVLAEIVDDTANLMSAGMVSAHAALVALGFVVGLYGEMRKPN